VLREQNHAKFIQRYYEFWVQASTERDGDALQIDGVQAICKSSG